MSDEIALTPGIGDVVRYSDMANPGSTYILIDIEGSNYKLRSVEKPYRVHYSDLRQVGWKVLRDSVDRWFRVRVTQDV